MRSLRAGWLLGLMACSQGSVRLNPVASETREYTVLVSGTAPRRARVAIRGGATKAVVQADDNGQFRAQVALAPSRVNSLTASLAEEAEAGERYDIKQLPPDVSEVLARRVEPAPVQLSSRNDLIGDRVVLRGRAAIGNAVEVEGGADVVTTTTDGDGEFAAEVPLPAREGVRLQLRTIDRFGNRSAAVVYDAPTPLWVSDPAGAVNLLQVDELPKELDGNRATLRGHTAPGSRVHVRTPRGSVESFANGAGQFAVGVALGSGENHFVLSSTSPRGVASQAVALSTAARTTPHVTKYPLVLVHGMGGFNTIFGYEYWWGIREHLQAHGFEVLVVEMTMIGTIERRSQELLEQVRGYTDGQVNLIGHSQGCLDVRYMASQLDASQVASVTTIAGPHQGSRIADVALGLIPGAAETAIDLLLCGIGWDWNIVRELSEKHMITEFNPKVRDVPGLHYQSWTGAADPFGWTTGVSLSAYLYPSWLVLHAVDGDDSDGLVPVHSGKWGTFRGVMPADHVTEVGQIAGLTHGFDHKAFWLALARDLAQQGY